MPTKQINQIRIAVTGPESTGKTTLAKQLAEWSNGQYIAEFAREYVEKLPHPYTFQDVETIARTQIEQYLQTKTSHEKIFIFTRDKFFFFLMPHAHSLTLLLPLFFDIRSYLSTFKK